MSAFYLFVFVKAFVIVVVAGEVVAAAVKCQKLNAFFVTTKHKIFMFGKNTKGLKDFSRNL